MIYTTATLARQPFRGYCEGGDAKVKAMLERNGLDWNSRLSLRFLLEEVGVADCVFGFCKVCKGCEAEADTVLRQFMGYMFHVIVNEFNPADCELYAEELKATRKRFEGYARPIPLARAVAAFTAALHAEPDPAKRYALDALRCLASDRPDALAACHASMALAEAGRVRYNDNRINDMLRDHLRNLLPETKK